MLKSLQGYHPRQMIWIIFLSILSWMPAFVRPDLFPLRCVFSPAPFEGLFRSLQHLPVTATTLLFFAVFLISGYLLVILNNQYLFLKSRTFLPLFFLASLTSPVLGLAAMSDLAFTVPLFLGAIFLAFRTYRNNRIDLSYFPAALWVGIASLFSIKAIFFLPILWIALITLRPFYPREWLVSLLGFLTPWYLYLATAYLFGLDPATILNRLILPGLTAQWSPFSPDRFQHFMAGYLALLILVTSFHGLYALSGMKIRSRKFHMIFFWNAVVAVILMIIHKEDPGAVFPYLALSLSLLFSLFFSGERITRLKSVLFNLYLAGFLGLLIARIIL